jgi:hypothetical protein
MMSSYPHAIKLVQKDPYDDYQGGMYYLTWWESANKKFILANFPTGIIADAAHEYAVYVTDGVVERVIVDYETAEGGTIADYNSHNELAEEEFGDNTQNGGLGEIDAAFGKTGKDERVTAYFTKASNILYTSYDAACETAFFAVEPCLDKGDMLFIIDSTYMTEYYDPSVAGDSKAKYPNGGAVTVTEAGAQAHATYESGNLYTIKKIYKEDPTATTWTREDRFRIVLDKNIPFDGTGETFFQGQNHTQYTKKRGLVNLFKFSPATTGNYDFVAPCSNRGICDEGTCECFKGYTDDNCNIQSSLAV